MELSGYHNTVSSYKTYILGFYFGVLTSGQFCDVPIIGQWEKNQIPPICIRYGYFYHELSYVRLLLIHVQILFGDPRTGHLGSTEVTRGVESESPRVAATSQESESESIKLPRLQLQNVLFELVI